MSEPFQRVYVYPSPTQGGIYVSWEITPTFTPDSGSWVFHVERAQSGGEWTRLTEGDPLNDVDYYLDTTSLAVRYGKIETIAYRVVLVDGSTEYESSPEYLADIQTASEWAELRALLGYVNRQFEEGGIDGWLYRKRAWGATCSCVDANLGAPADSECTICYGTGIVGGYWTPISYQTIILQPSQHTLLLQQALGLRDPAAEARLGPAYLTVEPDDVWLDAACGRFFKIQKVTPRSVYKGRPILYAMEMTGIASHSIEYQLPAPSETQGEWHA